MFKLGPGVLSPTGEVACSMPKAAHVSQLSAGTINTPSTASPGTAETLGT